MKKDIEELLAREEREPELRPIISLPSEDQETIIVIRRTEPGAIISTTDTTMKTKLDKMVENSNQWKCTNEDGPVKWYEVKDKTLISYRKDKTKREMSDEQREAAAERLRLARESR